jgi:type II secretory pathway component PulM
VDRQYQDLSRLAPALEWSPLFEYQLDNQRYLRWLRKMDATVIEIARDNIVSLRDIGPLVPHVIVEDSEWYTPL